MKIGLTIGIVVLSAVAVGLSAGKMATAELLEKGIYTEETVGDLEKAVTIYQDVIEQSDAERPYAARAHLRLGLCYQKMERMEEAMAVFSKLVASYPEQEDLVTQANRQLANAGNYLTPEQVRRRVDAAVKIISTCTESDPRVIDALATLHGLDSDVVATELAGYLNSKEPTLRRSAVYILYNAKIKGIGPAVPGLLKLCSHDEDMTRGMAALALGTRKVEDAYAALVTMTTDDGSGYARRCAAYALGLLGNREAQPVLEQALKDPDSLVANNAKAALAMLSTTETSESPTAKPAYSQTHHIELLPDGSGHHISTTAKVNRSDKPLHVYSFINSYDNIVQVLDENDEELAFDVKLKAGHYTFQVARKTPVPPGEPYQSKIVTRNDALSTQLGDIWVYERHHTPNPETDYQETLRLPPGAELVTVEPEPTAQTEDEGVITIRWEKILAEREAFWCKITYRLASSDTSAATVNSIQVLIDAAQPGSVVHVPKGTFAEPLTIDKALTLRGVAAGACVLELTSDQPALVITSTDPVKIEELTIKWQRATTRRQSDPVCAVVIQDTPATLRNCLIEALGGDTRSPCAVLAMGFADLTLQDCRLDGFEYTVQISGGAKGVVEDCVVLNPGHCGITVGNDARGTLRRNVVAGSAFHGIRCTGGELDVENNLIIQNKNRGIYLGNRSATGAIRNNLILGNATGISGFSQSRLDIENNLILDSSYAGLDFRASCRLAVNRNILAGNVRGIVLVTEGEEMQTQLGQNTLWDNGTTVENLELPADALRLDPQFLAADQGDFTVHHAALNDAGQGLQDAAALQHLWGKWLSVSEKVR